jgi:lipopolysaccharide biosynthesis glycosyltransferase
VRLDIVASCDDNFAQHTCVMLTSLFCANENASFRVFLLVPECFLDESKRNIEASLGTWSHEIRFLRVPQRDVDGLKVYGHITTAMYYRLHLARMIPDDVKKVIYLDSDIIVKDSISGLLDIDLSKHALAAVPDAFVARDASIRTKLGLCEDAKYFNSGMLIINLDLWKEHEIGTRAIDFAKSNPESITYPDQCALNHVVQGNYFVLDPKWNFQVHHMRRRSQYRVHRSSREEAERAVIIHFTTADKPWLYMCSHPLKHLYFDYLQYTVWRDVKEQDRTLRKRIRKYLGEHVPLAERAATRLYIAGKRVLSTGGNSR